MPKYHRWFRQSQDDQLNLILLYIIYKCESLVRVRQNSLTDLEEVWHWQGTQEGRDILWDKLSSVLDKSYFLSLKIVQFQWNRFLRERSTKITARILYVFFAYKIFMQMVSAPILRTCCNFTPRFFFSINRLLNPLW